MGWLWLGLAIGLLVGAGAVALLLRAVGGLTGTDLRSVGRLVVDGLTPGRRREGVAAQRALARRLKRAGERTASGRRVAAEELLVHVSPEDHDTIGEALGIGTAEADLAEFYRGHASRGNWLVGAEPQVRIVKDISLRPRQVFVRTTTRAAAAPAVPREAPSSRAHAATGVPREAAPTRAHTAPEDDDAPTDVLPRAADRDTTQTAVYPAGLLIGDLVVVHGTDVRTVTPAEGVLRIGRGAHNDLVLERPGVVRDHLVLEARDDGWWAVPGATQGGTKLDGAVLDGPAPIRDTAVLELGRGVRVRVSVGPA